MSLAYVMQLACERSPGLVYDAQRLQVTGPANVLSASETYRCSAEGDAGGGDWFLDRWGVQDWLRGGVLCSFIDLTCETSGD
mgnify:CR=1 FL=1